MGEQQQHRQKTAIITGASQGIGAPSSKRSPGGYSVVANSRTIQPSGDPNVIAIAGDAADPQTADRVVAAAVDQFGRIDTLVNNAGIFMPKPSSPARSCMSMAEPMRGGGERTRASAPASS